MGTNATLLLLVVLPLVIVALGGSFVTGRHRAVGRHFQHELRHRWVETGPRQPTRRASPGGSRR